MQDKPEVDVCILVPGETFNAHFLQSLMDGFGALLTKGKSVAFLVASSAVLPDLRNSLISGQDDRYYHYATPFENRPYKPKKIVFLDSDMAFTPDHLLKLVESDEPIISGWYLRREGFPVVMKALDESYHRYTPYTFEELQGTDLIEIGTNGLGFVCVTYEVLEKIGYPWFKFYQQPSDDEGKTFPPLNGEDVWFFNRAREEGFRVMLDPTLHIGHLKTVPLGVNNGQAKP